MKSCLESLEKELKIGSGSIEQTLAVSDLGPDGKKLGESLRDKEFTKKELMELEKKQWIEIKDLIFETEPKILDYLSYHCRRWRQTQANNLAENIKLKHRGLQAKKSNTLRASSIPAAAGSNFTNTMKKQ